MIAGLSANHLAALEFAPAWRRLYVARDNDAAGLKAANRLHERGAAAGIEIRDLVPVHGDFNLDLCRLGPAGLLAHLVGPARPVRPGALPALPISAVPLRLRPEFARYQAGRKKAARVAVWYLDRPERAARAAFTAGDLPEAPGGRISRPP